MAPAAALPDPCTLVTAAEAKVLTSFEMSGGAGADPTLCTWSNASAKSAVVVRVVPVAAGQTASATVTSLFQQYAGGATPTAVAGLGDAAGSATPISNGSASAIAVAKGRRAFIILVVPAESAAALQQAAGTATSRL